MRIIPPHWRAELLQGSGYLLVSQVPQLHHMRLAQASRYLLDAARTLGRTRPQDALGRHVRVLQATNSITGEIPFHTDAGDVLTLYCHRGAVAGGEIDLIDSAELHEHILCNDRELFEMLHRPWEFERKGRLGPDTFPYPPYYCPYGLTQCFLQLGSLKRRYGTGRDSDAAAALARLERTYLLDTDRHIRITLEPGGLLVINNRRILHRRSQYRNGATVRTMIRCWLDLTESPYEEWEPGNPPTCLD